MRGLFAVCIGIQEMQSARRNKDRIMIGYHALAADVFSHVPMTIG